MSNYYFRELAEDERLCIVLPNDGTLDFFKLLFKKNETGQDWVCTINDELMRDLEHPDPTYRVAEKHKSKYE
jgi:hypothetical protein